MKKQPAIFLDRDDTLNVDVEYTHKLADFRWVRGAPEALRLFSEAGLDVFIVTNQGGIGRGLFTENDMHRFNDHLIAEAAAQGGHIKDVAFCPHHPKAAISTLLTPCPYRKPGHQMISDLAEKWSLDLAASVMIGDRDSDVAAGRAAGCHAYLFDGSDLHELAKHVMNQHFPHLPMERS
ncbi:MAG: D-glycero-alpha-D-manno-heptose-1,7-bisphosphate 7-phosphatase [Candidatus Puniceispirillaceae bacterium]